MVDQLLREEQDSLGIIMVPADAYYGAHTMRAVENFPISTFRLPAAFIANMAMIKKYAARANESFGLIDAEIAETIAKAADEVMAGWFADFFCVDVFQTGSGTSTNMNVNEVIASRANEILTGKKRVAGIVHPNDHVNCCQSSNDVFPSAVLITAYMMMKNRLVPGLTTLNTALEKKAASFSGVKKVGRTHLQDAVVMTLGDEFSGYARQVEMGIKRLQPVQERLLALPLGGTAVGTGLNAHLEFAGRVIGQIAQDTGIGFYEAENHFEAQACMDTAVEASGALKTIAVSMTKIANDIRFLASGPNCGLGEIEIPAVAPGSSIMPGKVNPVICEAVIQAAAQVIGNDAAITCGGTGGYFEINLMQPMIAHNLFFSIDLLANSATLLAGKCVDGIEANEKKCRQNVEKSLAVVTGLVPHIGYDRAAGIAKKAHQAGISIKEAAVSENVMPEEKLDLILYGK